MRDNLRLVIGGGLSGSRTSCCFRPVVLLLPILRRLGADAGGPLQQSEQPPQPALARWSAHESESASLEAPARPSPGHVAVSLTIDTCKCGLGGGTPRAATHTRHGASRARLAGSHTWGTPLRRWGSLGLPPPHLVIRQDVRQIHVRQRPGVRGLGFEPGLLQLRPTRSRGRSGALRRLRAASWTGSHQAGGRRRRAPARAARRGGRAPGS